MYGAKEAEKNGFKQVIRGGVGSESKPSDIYCLQLRKRKEKYLDENYRWLRRRESIDYNENKHVVTDDLSFDASYDTEYKSCDSNSGSVKANNRCKSESDLHETKVQPLSNDDEIFIQTRLHRRLTETSANKDALCCSEPKKKLDVNLKRKHRDKSKIGLHRRKLNISIKNEVKRKRYLLSEKPENVSINKVTTFHSVNHKCKKQSQDLSSSNLKRNGLTMNSGQEESLRCKIVESDSGSVLSKTKSKSKDSNTSKENMESELERNSFEMDCWNLNLKELQRILKKKEGLKSIIVEPDTEKVSHETSSQDSGSSTLKQNASIKTFSEDVLNREVLPYNSGKYSLVQASKPFSRKDLKQSGSITDSSDEIVKIQKVRASTSENLPYDSNSKDSSSSDLKQNDNSVIVSNSENLRRQLTTNKLVLNVNLKRIRILKKCNSNNFDLEKNSGVDCINNCLPIETHDSKPNDSSSSDLKQNDNITIDSSSENLKPQSTANKLENINLKQIKILNKCSYNKLDLEKTLGAECINNCLPIETHDSKPNDSSSIDLKQNNNITIDSSSENLKPQFTANKLENVNLKQIKILSKFSYNKLDLEKNSGAECINNCLPIETHDSKFNDSSSSALKRQSTDNKNVNVKKIKILKKCSYSKFDLKNNMVTHESSSKEKLLKNNFHNNKLKEKNLRLSFNQPFRGKNSLKSLSVECGQNEIGATISLDKRVNTDVRVNLSQKNECLKSITNETGLDKQKKFGLPSKRGDDSCSFYEENIFRVFEKHIYNEVNLDSWIDECEKCCYRDQDFFNPILFSKRRGEKINFFEDDDFCLIIMNRYQEDVLKEYGQNIICIDNSRSDVLDIFSVYEVTVLSVIDEYGESFPCVIMFSSVISDVNRYSSIMYDNFFYSIKARIGTLNCQYFVSPQDNFFYETWEKTIGGPGIAQNYFSSFYVEMDWKKNIKSLIVTKDQQIFMYDMLTELMKNTSFNSEKAFVNELYLLLVIFDNNDFTKFSLYFKKHYLKNYKKWSHYFRKDMIRISTNSDFYKFNKKKESFGIIGSLIKFYYNDCRKAQFKNIDNCFYITLKYIHDSIIQHRLKFSKFNKQIIHDMKFKHNDAFTEKSLIIFEAIDDSIWTVKHSQNESNSDSTEGDCKSTNLVIKLSNENCCSLYCKDCNICVHSYFCSCTDYFLNSTICIHVHFVVANVSLCKNQTDVQTRNCDFSLSPTNSFCKITDVTGNNSSEFSAVTQDTLEVIDLENDYPVVTSNDATGVNAGQTNNSEINDGFNSILLGELAVNVTSSSDSFQNSCIDKRQNSSSFSSVNNSSLVNPENNLVMYRLISYDNLFCGPRIFIRKTRKIINVDLTDDSVSDKTDSVSSVNRALGNKSRKTVIDLTVESDIDSCNPEVVENSFGKIDENSIVTLEKDVFDNKITELLSSPGKRNNLINDRSSHINNTNKSPEQVIDILNEFNKELSNCNIENLEFKILNDICVHVLNATALVRSLNDSDYVVKFLETNTGEKNYAIDISKPAEKVINEVLNEFNDQLFKCKSASTDPCILGDASVHISSATDLLKFLNDSTVEPQ